MKLSSTVFKDGHKIPREYTCDGENCSPHLFWSEIPEEAKSLALICEDPDAPSKVWTHWVIFNLPSDMVGIDRGIETIQHLKNGIIQGLNDSGDYGYSGPCPPGGEHRYFFKLYALNTKLEFDSQSLNEGISKKILLEAMVGHIIEEVELIGLYRRE
jgi:Raf kinase inhibitor-like YbhB/YbcL family protein